MARVFDRGPSAEGESGWLALASCKSLGEVGFYEKLKTLSDEALDQLLLILVVLPFGQDDCNRLDTSESLFNAVARDLQVDMRNHWRPDGDFLNRRTREQLVAIAGECGFADGHSVLNTWKKAELVNGLLRHFEVARSAVGATPAQEKAIAWLPDAMQFPAADLDAGEQPADGDDAGDDIDFADED
jgi:hypothetical protein